jgi:hypothetical protein
MSKLAALIASLAGLAVAAAPAFAHHSRSGFYQGAESLITLSGTVKEFRWINPHSFIILEVRDEEGAVTTWGVELGDPGSMVRSGEGWGHDALEPGDEISFETYPSRDGRTRSLEAHDLRFADGTRLDER